MQNNGNKIKPTTKDVLWNYFGIIMAMGSNFLILPFVLRYVSSDYVGLWFIYTSIGGLVLLLNFGFDPTVARSVAYCWSGADDIKSVGVSHGKSENPNYILLYKVYLTCKRIYSYIAFFALSILLLIGSFYIYHISKSVADSSVALSWFLYCIAIFLNLYFGFYPVILRGLGKIAYYNRANVISRLMQLSIAIFLLINDVGITSMSIAYLIYGISYRYLCRKRIFEIKEIQDTFFANKYNNDVSEVKRIFNAMWHNAWRDGVVSFSSYCSSQAIILICSSFFSLTSTGFFSLTMQIVTGVAMISSAYNTASQPSLQVAYARHDIESSQKMLAVSVVCYDILFWIGSFLVFFLIFPLLTIIKPQFNIETWLFISISTYIFLLRRMGLFAAYISNTNEVPYMLSFCLTSFFGIVGSVFLIIFFKAGLYGVVLGPLIALLCYNNWVWTLRAHKILKISVLDLQYMGIKECKNIISLFFKKLLTTGF